MSRPISHYQALGGDTVVRALVDAFYDAMESDPRAAGIRAMHPADLTTSRDKLYQFLSGWLGGPPLYTERHGHPRLRARHLPFVIDTAARDAWLGCMDAAFDRVGVAEPLRSELATALARVADFMRNADVAPMQGPPGSAHN